MNINYSTSIHEAISNFRSAISAAGLHFLDEIIADGKVHRFKANSDNHENSWYIMFCNCDGTFGGCFECYKRNIKENWHSKNIMHFSSEERKNYEKQLEEIHRKIEVERNIRTSEAKEKALQILKNSNQASADHPYIVKKQINPFNIRENTYKNIPNLIIPLMDNNDVVHTLQFIDPNGNKKFLTGGVKKGNYYKIGEPKTIIYIAEGYATCASIHEATHECTIVAFDSGNLLAVAQTIRKKYPNYEIVICADNDAFTENNIGVQKATAAAREITAKIAVPKFKDTSTSPTDWNDLMCLEGIGEVREQLANAIIATQPVDSDNESKAKCEITYRCLADIKAKPINWLWHGRIALGKVTIIAGNPGLGKSQITASIAAIITTGGLFPADAIPCPRGNVIFLSAEDDAADTIRPRLEAVSANLDNIFIIDSTIKDGNDAENPDFRQFSLKTDIKALGDLFAKIKNVRVIIIDPITAYLGGTDSHKNAEVRALLSPLSELASKYNVAVICVSHLSKNTNNDPLARVTGSLAFVAAARAAFIVIQDKEDKQTRLFLPIKNNIGCDTTGFAFKIESHKLTSGIETSRVIWSDEIITLTANEAMAVQNINTDKQSSLEDAKGFLLQILANEQISAKQIYKEAKDAGYSRSTINRAKKELSIQSHKDSFESGGWYWCLPSKILKSTEDSQKKNLRTFDKFENLREVRCADCTNFKPDTVGDGTGIGACLYGDNNRNFFSNTTLYPNILRKCANFESQQIIEQIR